jgi:inositol hexakisphosphate/diphosphoinositol-pentakisphosphate kinase
MYKRWKKIEEDFMIKNDENEERYDISKLPEVCDNIKYDMIHYPELREKDEQNKLLRLAQLMCMINVPFEYGITSAQKMKIGMKITHNLIHKIHHDLVWWKIMSQN